MDWKPGMNGLNNRSGPERRPDVEMIKRIKGTIQGIVQGVGFRPFIYQLAHRFGLTGYVINTSQGVTLEVEGYRPWINRKFLP